ncbi:MAG: hypothetical protein N2114_05995 [Candidatus Goldbacteria bacterium]|nr:hypothetical protein [Candidatus Goldiibacteriota bacterium]
MEDEKTQKEIGNELLKISQAKHKSAQEKYLALQQLAKKYNIPIEKLLRNIITGWVNEDKKQQPKKTVKGKINKIF